MSVTTAPAVKAKLVALFKAAVDETTEVWFNRTNEDHQPAENVYVCGVQGERDWSLLGGPKPHRMEENYTVEVDIEVYREGTDSEGPESRAWAIANLLEATLEDPTLGSMPNVQWVFGSRFKQKSDGGTDGWLAAVTLDVAVKARI